MPLTTAEVVGISIGSAAGFLLLILFLCYAETACELLCGGCDCGCDCDCCCDGDLDVCETLCCEAETGGCCEACDCSCDGIALCCLVSCCCCCVAFAKDKEQYQKDIDDRRNRLRARKQARRTRLHGDPHISATGPDLPSHRHPDISTAEHAPVNQINESSDDRVIELQNTHAQPTPEQLQQWQQQGAQFAGFMAPRGGSRPVADMPHAVLQRPPNTPFTGNQPGVI